MKTKSLFILSIMLSLLLATDFSIARDKIIKITENLESIKISENSYIHISYHDLTNSKHFPANGLIYVIDGKAIIIDTPWTDEETKALIDWLNDSLKVSIEGVVVTHWHIDCMGGLNAIHKAGIKSYASSITCEIARSKDLPVPEFGFSESLALKLGDNDILCRYLGAAHTRDNIVVWIPEEKILFGGCMLKALEWTGLGFTGDADVDEWPHTLNRVLEYFPDADIVIPGHGNHGDLALIHHTLELLKNRE
jgi:metallo-beta-lactamase class B